MRFGASITALLLIVYSAEPVRAAAPPSPTAPTPAQLEFFESKIRPVLADECYRCHSAGSEKLKGKLFLDTRAGMLKGGESEQPAIVPGNVEESSLVRAIRHDDEALTMPPKKKLPDKTIADFEAWVKMGAPTPDSFSLPAKTQAATTAPSSHPTAMTLAEGRTFWSFVPPREPAVPAATQPASLVRNEIDRFILAKLDEKRLTPSDLADKRTLIRRATYDLTGLPPSAKDVDDFESDCSPDAYEKLIDRLLASPRYGERWGRYWLDVARYADTKGYMFEEERRYAFSFTYRDWVIRAFNEDLPYDQFLVQQIAADRLDRHGDNRPLAALGFLTLGRRFIGNTPDIIDDRIDVVCRGTMALTVTCARCHDHKYDPIPSADYYSLYGVFASSIEPKELPLLGGDKPPQYPEYEKELAKRRADLDGFLQRRHDEIEAQQLRSADWLARYLLAAQNGVTPQPNFETIDDGRGLIPWMVQRWQAYLTTAAAKKDDLFAAWRRYSALPAAKVATTPIAPLPSDNPLVTRFVTSTPPKSIQEVAQRYAKLFTTFGGAVEHPDPQIEAIRQVLYGADSPATVTLADTPQILSTPDGTMQRQLIASIEALSATHPGSPPRAMAMEDAPQPAAPHIFKRGNPANLGAEVPRQFPAILSPDDRKPFKQGSGRLELAQAIANKSNPLTARVLVNRVWQYHFGYGLVRTPGDFGTRGEKPTHPELLDYLALRFENDDAWSIKKLHKRIMLSATYQQASLDRPDCEKIDPENRLLWRQNPRRLDFEAMRDSLLAASGAIDYTMGGRSVDITAEPFVPRRSVYAYIDRQNLPGLFRTFDFASPDSTSSRRFSTSVPQQALFMMNSPFVLEQAKKLAARAEIAKEPDAAKKVAELYRAVLGRTPEKQETDLAIKFVSTEQSLPTEPLLAHSNDWKYGTGEFDEASGRVIAFTPLPRFVERQFQGAADKLPDPVTGWAMLTAEGGHAGNDQKHATIRRWIAPRDCTIAVDGKLQHSAKEGDGVRARLVSSRAGALATWNIHHQSAQTNVTSISLQKGDTLDFVIDCGPRGDYSFDSFGWTIMITKEPAAANAMAGDDAGGTWNSVSEFAATPESKPKPLSPWEKYAQVLLESNEFAFVD